MTREEAQEILATVNGKLETRRLEAINLLFKEIDELKMMEEDAQQYALKCRKELEVLQQPKRCDRCGYGKTTINSVICGKNGTYKEADDYCKYYNPKEQ